MDDTWTGSRLKIEPRGPRHSPSLLPFPSPTPALLTPNYPRKRGVGHQHILFTHCLSHLLSLVFAHRTQFAMEIFYFLDGKISFSLDIKMYFCETVHMVATIEYNSNTQIMLQNSNQAATAKSSCNSQIQLQQPNPATTAKFSCNSQI
jgi:hypothetical protein